MADATQARMLDLGIALPAPLAAVADYQPFGRIGQLIVTSGQLPFVSGKLQLTGMIGRDLSVAEGRDVCRTATLNALTQIKTAAGTLDAVRIVRVEGVLRMSSSEDTPDVLVLDTGASDEV